MRTLDRYLLREFSAYSLLGLLTFQGIFILVDLFERLDLFVDHHTPVRTILRYYLEGTPAILTQALPIALLLGALIGLSQLRKHNEVTAMQASGQSPWRLARPLLAVALLASAAQYAMNETIGPTANARQKRIMIEEIKRQVASDRESRTEVRLIGAQSRFYVAHYYDARTLTLRQVSLQFLERPTLRGRIDAEAAQYQDGIWDFRNGFWRSFQDSTEITLHFRHFGDSRLAEVPADFARTNEDPFYMNMKTLLTFARRVRESGGDTQKHMTNFHIRASFPLANLIMVLLGTALSLRVVRGSGLALGIGLSLSIGFAYFTFIRVGQALGYNGSLPPLLAAWLANLVFGAMGGLLFWKVTR